MTKHSSFLHSSLSAKAKACPKYVSTHMLHKSVHNSLLRGYYSDPGIPLKGKTGFGLIGKA